jgi:hypothetical protein
MIGTVMLGLLLAGGISWKYAPSNPAAPPSFTIQDSPQPLTPAEEADLGRLTGQCLSWIKLWQPGPYNFLKDDQVEPYFMPDIFKQYAGQDVEMNLAIRELTLTVYLVPLHFKYTVRRYYDSGLGVPVIDYFGEDTYAERVADEERVAEQMRSRSQALEDVIRSAPPRPTTSVNFESSPSAKNKDSRQEVRIYKIPASIERPLHSTVLSTEQEKSLYEQIKEIALSEVRKFQCTNNQTLTVTIPDFQLGDPAIYILITPQKPEGASIEWIDFRREPYDGGYSAFHVKNISGEKEIKLWSELINERKISQLIEHCR